MVPFFIALAWVCSLAVLLIIVLRQSLLFEKLGPSRNLREAPLITVLVPARNEAENIGRCLEALLAQDYPPDNYTVVVINDGSIDNTAAIVQRYAAQDRRVRLIEAGALPDGWTGKAHACWRGAQEAHGEWLCFVDADTVLAPSVLSATVALAMERKIDMLSLLPFQELGTFWERIVFPPGLFMITLAVDLHRLNDPAKPNAMANGQYLLIRRHVYDAIDGHAAVRMDIWEDGAMAHLIKRAGYRLYVMSAGEHVRTRMYTNLNALWHGFSKHAVDLAGNIPAALAAGVGTLLLGWLPLVMTVWTLYALVTSPAHLDSWSLGISLVGSTAMLITMIIGAHYFRIPLWYGLLFPFGFTLVSGIAFNSVWRRLTKQVVWKDRVYSFYRQESDTH